MMLRSNCGVSQTLTPTLASDSGTDMARHRVNRRSHHARVMARPSRQAGPIKSKVLPAWRRPGVRYDPIYPAATMLADLHFLAELRLIFWFWDADARVRSRG
jgi:hypothetical protein